MLTALAIIGSVPLAGALAYLGLDTSGACAPQPATNPTHNQP